jgi:hypothetical protein
VGFGVAAGVAAGVAVGFGVAAGVAVGLGVAEGVAVGFGLVVGGTVEAGTVGLGVDTGFAVAVGAARLCAGPAESEPTVSDVSGVGVADDPLANVPADGVGGGIRAVSLEFSEVSAAA